MEQNSANNEETDIIQENDYVIIQRADRRSLHRLSKNGKMRIPHLELHTENVIGKPYWSVFHMELIKKNVFNLRHVTDPYSITDTDLLAGVKSGINNQLIIDDDSKQLLTRNDIEKMKEKGVGSEEIIKNVMNNNKSFSMKTEYSQQKYVAKKSKKYADKIQILKPTLRLVTEIFTQYTPHKVLGLKFEMLSKIITAVNFQAHGKYILYENGCEGLVKATLINYIGTDGKIFNILTTNNRSKKQAVDALQFSEETKKTLINIKSSLLCPYLSRSGSNLCISNTDLTMDCAMTENQGTLEPTLVDAGLHQADVETKNLFLPNNIDCNNLSLPCDDISDSVMEIASGNSVNKVLESAESDSVVQYLLNNKADGLIVVTNEIPNEIVKDLLKLVKLSGNFVVYSQYREVLSKLFLELKQQRNVVNVRLFDNWLRMYQVLENRTHPHVKMNRRNGFLLVGTLVEL